MDDSGNAISAANNGLTAKLWLKLTSENKKRYLGFISLKQRVFNVRRKRGIHLLKRFNAYGFCYKILSEAKTFDFVGLKDDYDEWKIPRQYILEHGIRRRFGESGFEFQIFLPLDKMDEFKTKPII